MGYIDILTHGGKTREIIPSEKLIETHPLMYYLIILKLTIVVNGFLAKILITLNELYYARKAENKSGKYTDVLKMTISNIKSFFNPKKERVKK
ncbi:hypothetical protein [Proteus mirabilis]|nr:hypothetical protein [Proteus mirabilis]